MLICLNFSTIQMKRQIQKKTTNTYHKQLADKLLMSARQHGKTFAIGQEDRGGNDERAHRLAAPDKCKVKSTHKSRIQIAKIDSNPQQAHFSWKQLQAR